MSHNPRMSFQKCYTVKTRSTEEAYAYNLGCLHEKVIKLFKMPPPQKKKKIMKGLMNYICTPTYKTKSKKQSCKMFT